MDKLVVKGAEISVQWNSEQDDFISLTDIAKLKDSDNPRYIIQNWLRNRNTIEFLGVWESLYNPSFNRVEFDAFRSQAGLNSFVMTPQKWVESTGARACLSLSGDGFLTQLCNASYQKGGKRQSVSPPSADSGYLRRRSLADEL